MLDIKFIRENPKKVKEGCLKKGVKVDIDLLLEVDKKRRETLQDLEDIRAQKNKANKEIQQAKGQGEKSRVILKMRELDKNSDRLTKTLKTLNEEFNDLMRRIPNLPQDDVPTGKDEKENVVLKEVGEKPKFAEHPLISRPRSTRAFDFKPKDYMEIAEKLDLIDVKRAGKVAGARFGYIKREAALIEFALVNLAFEVLVKEGFIPIIPPVMLKSEMAQGMGYLEQADKEEAYYLPKDDLYLVGTSEQSVGVMYANEVLEEKELPKRYVGFSTCFRREAGAYGKDTKGILRVHQFDKIEMFSFTKPEESRKEHKFFLEMEEGLMQTLKIPYRVLNICSGDLGRPASAKYDIESWMPGQNQYRETHSTSNCTDFQARRLNIRYKDKNNKLNFVHTVNGTAFAIGRILIAIIENYQQKDGSILVPEVLQKYTGFKKISR
ncbi:MAG: serine--tRNA ligase [Candidatus Nealsonbacteria bacterium]|nr:serine--tRNA ligase [Candidatus Nealsonbacteria bacterium]